jgi:predicted aconitase with swiveling domain
MTSGKLTGRALAPGTASAEAIVLDEPLSLWGGLDPTSGEVIEPRHPQRGASLAGRVVVMAQARGSSSSSSVLAEAVRAGAAPAAILLAAPDLILAVGAAVADELYRVQVPIVVLDRTDLAQLRTGDRVTIGEDGAVHVG